MCEAQRKVCRTATYSCCCLRQRGDVRDGAVLILGHRSITDVMTALLAVTTAAILWRSTKVPEPLIVLGAAILGLVAYPFAGR